MSGECSLAFQWLSPFFRWCCLLRSSALTLPLLISRGMTKKTLSQLSNWSTPQKELSKDWTNSWDRESLKPHVGINNHPIPLEHWWCVCSWLCTLSSLGSARFSFTLPRYSPPSQTLMTFMRALRWVRSWGVSASVLLSSRSSSSTKQVGSSSFTWLHSNVRFNRIDRSVLRNWEGKPLKGSDPSILGRILLLDWTSFVDLCSWNAELEGSSDWNSDELAVHNCDLARYSSAVETEPMDVLHLRYFQRNCKYCENRGLCSSGCVWWRPKERPRHKYRELTCGKQFTLKKLKKFELKLA